MSAPTITRTPSGTVVLRFPFDAWLVDALKAQIPVHARTYDPETRAWTVRPPYTDMAARLMFTVFPDTEIVVYRGSAGPGFDRAPHAGDPYRTLHLLPSAPRELVTAAHRCLAKLNHPDRGGDHDVMLALNHAVDEIRGAR